jgi:hypothetical protein
MRKSKLQETLETYQRIEKIWDTPAYKTAVKRVPKLSTHDLLNWADTASIGLGQGFDDYKQHGTPESLYEIREKISAMQALVEELMKRHEA